MTPALRLRPLNDRPLQRKARYVLYWMVAARRLRFNFGLQRAVEWARKLELPLVVYEPLRVDYPHASDRFHRFIIDGMCDHEEHLRESPVLYYPYVEPAPGAAKGMLEALAEQAAVVVTDESFTAFLPRMIEAAAARLPVSVEAIDSNGLLPVRATPRVFQTAASFRSFLRQNLGEHLRHQPLRDPLLKVRLGEVKWSPISPIVKRWPMASRALLDGDPRALAELPIDHSVPSATMRGGSHAGRKRMRHFVQRQLDDYQALRDRPELDATSRLSPYLHFGQLSAHEVFGAVKRHVGRIELGKGPSGLFRATAEAEAFLDQLVTWRELALNMASKLPEAARYDALPQWAKDTLKKHAADPRPRLETVRALEQGQTRDVLFNAAQRQLAEEGWYPNAMRMIWGKKILEYSKTPKVALQTMHYLMDRYSLDGRDPNSTAGIGWVLGRYDRPWGPERPVFGTVRFMTSDTPEKRRRYAEYIERYSVPASERPSPKRRPKRPGDVRHERHTSL